MLSQLALKSKHDEPKFLDPRRTRCPADRLDSGGRTVLGDHEPMIIPEPQDDPSPGETVESLALLVFFLLVFGFLAEVFA
jgi:hypothetical protein